MNCSPAQRAMNNPKICWRLTWVIADALQLQDSSASNRTPNRRYYVKLISFLNKAGIVVSHPMQDEKLLAIEGGLS